MLIDIPFGRGAIQAEVAAECLLGIFDAREEGEPEDEGLLLRRAMENPIGSPRLRRLARPGKTVCIVTSDLTRPCPNDRLLPYVLEELSAGGVADEDILIVAALGLHRPMSPAELEQMVGRPVAQRIRVVNHDPDDTLHLGVTSRGTPVEFFRPLVEADMRVCLGNLEFHYFVGYSGGAKAILPGCASRACVNANHAMMVQPEALAGRLDGNPVRVDLEEGVAMVGVDFLLNVLVDGEHRIGAAFAGDVQAAHRAGCQAVSDRGMVPVPTLADIVLTSAGGYPKDVNLYQAQKALDNAVHAVRPGGIVILAAECPEGYGNTTFEEWLCRAGCPGDLLEWIQQEFVLGGHKAAAVGAVLQRADVFLVSHLPEETVRRSGMLPFRNAETALEEAFRRLGPMARIAFFPHGGSVLPQSPVE